MHVATSVAWLGAVASFLVLAVTGLVNQSEATVRASYVAMEIIAWTVIVPLSLASPVSGIVQALGTNRGLLRYYWVLVKLLMTVPSTAFLLLHMQPISLVGRAAEHATLSSHLDGLRIQLAVDAGAALLVLLVTTVLAVYKPQGLTPYGAHKQSAAR